MKKSKSVGFAFLISLIVLLAMIIFYKSSFFVLLDLKTNLFSSVVQDPLLTKIFTFVGLVFDPIVMVVVSLLIALFIWKKYSRKDGLFFAIVAIVGGFAIEFFKLIFERARPLNGLVAETGSSFPSGHATFAVVLFGLLSYFVLTKKGSKLLKRNFVIFSLLLIALIGFSRLYLNVHWFSDVIVGFSLGATILFAGIWIKNKWF